MKAFVSPGLLLLIFGMWRCSGIEPVSVECDYFKLRVIAKRALFYPDELIHHDELFLGPGCPVTSMTSAELEFSYELSFCGTFIEHAFDRTIVNNWLTYKPRNTSLSAELQLQCVIPRHPYDVDNLQRHAPQCWFLVLKRYCNICGHFHLPENWSKPFFGWKNDSSQRTFHSLCHR
ncbi:oocyte-secreted protein 3-like [Rattus rattus]|uniref:oocyte-secreted protein 3-like n=1 Tax=Rattus rattus TaxID=10117 RepID=UPI0013F30942|nr:oocyte-secreted protein 3-like [Rattus rattus]